MIKTIWPLLAVSLLVPMQAESAPVELFFSEYVEGSSNNKALEIFNATGSAVDLSFYDVQFFFNGNSSAGNTIPLSGILADGDVFVLADDSSSTPSDMTAGGTWFNGDDAIVLRKGTTILDVIGQIGNDPGSQWGSLLVSTADNTLRRKSTVLAGDADGSDAFDPSVEWDGFATDTFDGLGTHAVRIAQAPAVPEPATMALMFLALAGLVVRRRSVCG